MKKIILGLLAFTLSLSAAAAPALIEGEEREIYMKSLRTALESQNNFFICREYFGGQTKSAQSTFATNSKDSLKLMAVYEGFSISKGDLYVNKGKGLQPVFQIVARGSANENIESSLSLVADPEYKSIIQLVFQKNRRVEKNVGDLLNPVFEIVSEPSYTINCRVQ
jgi:hypothetical protein